MCESLVGAEKPATRQKGTETLSPAGVPKRPPVLGTSKSGGVVMDFASVMVTFGIFSDARLSQDCCAEARAAMTKKTASTVRNKNRLHFIVVSPSALPLLRVCGGGIFFSARIITPRVHDLLQSIWNA